MQITNNLQARKCDTECVTDRFLRYKTAILTLVNN